MTYEDLHRSRRVEITKLAYTQKVPGLTADEVAQELSTALWKAWKTYDPTQGLTLGQWWWVIWIRHKATLIEAFFRNKVEQVPMTPQELAALAPVVLPNDLIPCPSTDDTAKRVWGLLAQGFQITEVRAMVGKRRFYQIIDQWRTPEVQALLT